MKTCQQATKFLLALIFYCFYSSNCLAQQAVPLNRAVKNLHQLIADVQHQNITLYQQFDTASIGKITKELGPVFRKYFSAHLKEIEKNAENIFGDTSIMAVLLYNNVQYLNHIDHKTFAITPLREMSNFTGADTSKQQPFLQGVLTFSLRVGKEKRDIYHLPYDEQGKLLGIYPILQFGTSAPTPLLDKKLKRLLDWRSTSKTIFKLEAPPSPVPSNFNP